MNETSSSSESGSRLATYPAPQADPSARVGDVARRFDAALHIALELVSETELEKLLLMIIRHAIDLLEADDGVFLSYRSDLDVLEWWIHVNADTRYKGIRLARGDGLAGKAWDTGSILQVTDYNRWEGRSAVFAGRPNRSIIAVPLNWRNEFLGVMTFSTGSHRVFSDLEAELLGFFAAQTSVVVHNAKVNEENQRRVRELTVIHQATSTLTNLRTPDALSQEVIRILEQTVAYDYGAVLLTDWEHRTFFPFALSEQDKGAGFIEKDKAYLLSRGLSVDRGITGWVATHGQSICLGDVRSDPRYFSMRQDIRSELCVPLLVDGRVIGVINTETSQADAYTAADQLLLETVAAHIAIAIQNAFLLEREQATSLELRHLAARLQTSIEDERTRIARLIHDNLGQALTALKFDLFWLGRKTPETEEIQEKIGQMSKLIDGTIQQVRQLSVELRPGVLDDLGLSAALEWLAEDFSQRTGIETELSAEGSSDEMPANLATALFRISQEALTNVARHAQADHVRIGLKSTNDEWMLVIEDDGLGIDTEAVQSTHALGLLGMQERVLPFHGNLRWSGAPGEGTAVRVWVPNPKKDEMSR